MYSKKLLVWLIVSAALLLGSFALYSATTPYKATSKSDTIVKNSTFVLGDFLTPQSQNILNQKLAQYIHQKGLPNSGYTLVDNKVIETDAGYSFLLRPPAGGEPFPVIINVLDYGDILAHRITIDGVEQGA